VSNSTLKRRGFYKKGTGAHTRRQKAKGRRAEGNKEFSRGFKAKEKEKSLIQETIFSS
jgi:hypothetical protein